VVAEHDISGVVASKFSLACWLHLAVWQHSAETSEQSNMPFLQLQVVEFESLGIRVRNTKRFFILNPTSITYEFVWAPVLPPAVAALGGPPPPSPFNCVVRKGSIAEGR
jgi:hypothetical protein